MTTYSKPAVRRTWAQLAGGADLQDPGDTYVAAGYLLGVKPPRQYDNWLYNYVFNAVRYFCQQGVSDWDTAETYAVNAIVQGTDNNLYQAILASTGVNPVGNPSTWGPVQGSTPANTDHSNSFATTGWVNTNYLASTTPVSALSGTVTNAQVPVGAVTQWQGSLSITGAQVSGAVARANAFLLSNGNYVTPQWVAQTGQPNWLFGSNDGINVSIWNPSNFTVNNSANLNGFAPNTNGVGNTVALRDPNGYIIAAYFNQNSPNQENPTISQFIVTNGSDGFFRKSNIPAVQAALGVLTAANFSLAVSGGNASQRIASAGIIQGGRASISGTTVVTFPLAFPHQCFAVVFTNESSTNQIFLNGQPSTTSFTATNGTAVIDWVAFGN